MATGRRKPRFEDFYGDVGHVGDDEGEDSRDTDNGPSLVGPSRASKKNDSSEKKVPGPKDQGVPAWAGLERPRIRQVNEEKNPWTSQVTTHIEWEGGPAPRCYRRSQREARRMTIEICQDGDKIKRSEQDVMSEPCTVCNSCRKTSSVPLKRCQRCLAVSYCDKECQLQAFSD
ncbi:hypothetical protein EGW08_022976, partial [Elysia chlorotica]